MNVHMPRIKNIAGNIAMDEIIWKFVWFLETKDKSNATAYIEFDFRTLRNKIVLQNQ